MENLDSLFPQIKDGKMARFCPSHGFILDLGGWGFAVPFYFVQDCSSEDDFILDIKQPVQETGDWCHIWEGWHACMPFG